MNIYRSILPLAGAATLAFGVQVATANEKDTSMTTAALFSKLHAINMEEIHAGNLAKTKGSTEKVREFGQTLIDDHRKADQQVMDLAKEKNITISAVKPMGGEKAMEGTTRPMEREQGMQGTAGERGGSMNQPGEAYGTAQGGTGEKSGEKTGEKAGKMADHAAKMKRLETLTGAAFDRAFLEMMADEHAKGVNMLQAQRDRTQAHDEAVIDLIVQLQPVFEKHRDRARELLKDAERPS